MTKTIKQTNPPDLPDVLEAWARDTKTTINAVQIGIIQAFNAENQTATIQIALKQVKEIDPETRVRTFVEYPVLLECPVMVLFGGVDFLTMPIAAGDSCIVLFNDREIDNWFVTGEVSAPTSSRVHDLSDGLALVGVRSLQNSIANYLTNGIRLSHSSGDNTAKMDFTDALIDSVATLFQHTGNMRIDGNVTITGNIFGEGGGFGTVFIDSNIVQTTGRTLAAGNGATGTFDVVTVENGIVTGGS